MGREEMFKTNGFYEVYCLRIWRKVRKMNASELHGMKAYDILAMCDQLTAVPVDVKKILEALSISAIPFDFSDMEKKLDGKYKGTSILGAMVSNDEDTAIFYNHKDKNNSHRARFTIAHEIAHCCLHGPLPHVEFRFDKVFQDHSEVEANIFAGELLIPEHSLKNTISKLIVPTVTALADIFDVSFNVMKERIEYLKLTDEVMGIE